MPQASSAEKTLTQLLDDLAAKTPTPGGGAVASITGALSSALAAMVVNYSVNKKSLAQHRLALEEALDSLTRARGLLLGLAAEDEAAYAELSALWKLDEADPGRAGMAAAVERAIQAPRAVLGACINLLRQLEDLVPITNRNLRSDLAIAAILAEAGARTAGWNVLVNAPLLHDEPRRDALDEEVRRQGEDAAERCRRIEAGCREVKSR